MVLRCPSDLDHLPDWKAHIKLHGQPLGTWTLLAKDRVSKKTATDLRDSCVLLAKLCDFKTRSQDVASGDSELHLREDSGFRGTAKE